MLGLVDGDVFAHKCCKSRFKKASTVQGYTDIHTIVPNRFEHNFTQDEDRQYLEQSWKTFQEQLDEALEACFASEYLMAMKSSVNYRDEIYPITWAEGTDKTRDKPIWGYKANRWKPPAESNKFVPTIRKLAIHEGLAIEAYGREADDYLRIWALQAERANEPYVVISVDKDLDCIPGKHYNITERRLYDVSKRDALRFSYQQLLSGDGVDNIPGVLGLGPIKSAKLMYNLHEEEEFQEVVVEMYMSVYEDGWYEMLLSNGKLLHIQRYLSDYFSVSNWPVVKAFEAITKKYTVAPPILGTVKEVAPVVVTPAIAPKPPEVTLRPPAPSLRAPTAPLVVPLSAPKIAHPLAITTPKPANASISTGLSAPVVKRTSPSLTKG